MGALATWKEEKFGMKLISIISTISIHNSLFQFQIWRVFNLMENIITKATQSQSETVVIIVGIAVNNNLVPPIGSFILSTKFEIGTRRKYDTKRR